MQTRKNLRLENYDYTQAGAYFVTVCTNGKKNILGSVVGGDAHIAPHTRLSPIGQVVEKYLLSIPGMDSYVIMPNHVHIILLVSSTDMLQGPMWASAPTGKRVGSLVRSWKTLVSKELGKSIWQRSYYDHIIRNEKDYIRIAQYIEDNPSRWREDTYYCES